MKAVVVEQYDTIDNIPLRDVAMPDVAAHGEPVEELADHDPGLGHRQCFPVDRVA